MALSLVRIFASVVALGGLVSCAPDSPNLQKRDLVVADNSSLQRGQWHSLGCYVDPGPRTLQGPNYVDHTNLTEEGCVAFCDTQGYIYAGLEYSSECYCGNSLTTNTSVPMTDCNMPCSGNATEACGGGNRLNLFWSNHSGPITNPGPPGWSFVGCYSEGTTGRALPNGIGIVNVTVALCTTACNHSGYTMAGVEFSKECYCGNSIVNGGALSPGGVSDCNMMCAGNFSEYCGAGGKLDVYVLGSLSSSSASSSAAPTSTSSSSSIGTPSPTSSVDPPSLTSTSSSAAPTQTGPIHVPSVNGYNWIGCYTEATGSRALTSAALVNYTSMTVEMCQAFCSSPTKYTYFGVEYAGECYCGNALHTGSVIAPTTDCSMRCDGSNLEYCGAGNRLDMYQLGSAGSSSSASSKGPSTSVSSSLSSGPTTTSSSSAAATQTGPIHVPSVNGYNWIGCYTEATGSRALTNAALVNYTSMTVEMCQAFCSSPTKYTYFGVEYAGECYCGNALHTGSVIAPTTDCSMHCDGSNLEYCGAGNRLDMYQLNSSAPTSTAASSAASSVTASVSSSPIPDPTGLPANWKYSGCWTEGVGNRALSHGIPASDSNTVEVCINACISLGYTVAGVEYGTQCYCDNDMRNGPSRAPESDCSFACPGNSLEKCGAGDRLNVYYTGTLTVLSVPSTQTQNLPGSWNYSGCITDNVNNVRALFWQIILTNNNTATNCLGLCSSFGFMSGGMEYGDECYCGDASSVAASGSTLRPDSECATPCSGDPQSICGDGNRLSYYTWQGTPLYNWATPQGTGAGQYSFFVPGVVVPLMTSLAINGKITFLEKHGTGAPNSTGAYELDPSLVNDFSAAWRTMNLKTDVFCSGGLTLPDKAGRQLTVGGWSGISTYGVRLYTPDGSLGVPSKNDWQENANELSLQTSRWYPSLMLMSNGSILVIGGEVGSNSAPSPSLEILPKPPGGYLKMLDWLQRTDPNNLYPFIAVLPSGRIICMYYNEARILDPVTFDTLQVLPNMPGSVNNFLAGRSYPLEGTCLIFPQHAPYTDPLTVMACGGSATGNGQAIDNCVSIQPEVAGQNWTIERMPSQRVMTCITALPDGTFLIVNGAKQGVAGFGLATNPNLGAVLFDPTKPVGSRFSIMATTIVARLYHSESMLLQDGSVLISGSDPQDNTHPEEYRVEVFKPPYLLSGLKPPTFTISSTDMAYGQQFQVTVNLFQGTTATMRISLLALVSSTHGNSMGMRTLFPAFTCAGNTCTVTAPPNAFVAPPAWYQIFVLDGPTPSVSKFIRIGGDPGKLGLWPNFSDFTTPGL